MALRVHKSGGVINATAGRVHITRYPGEVTLELAQHSQADYVQHLRELGAEVAPLVFIANKPFPLPSLDVRTYWREAAQDVGFEAIAMIITGVVGLMAATVTSFSEQLVGVLDVNVRSFKTSDDAAEWLTSRYECEIDEVDLAEAIDEVMES